MLASWKELFYAVSALSKAWFSPAHKHLSISIRTYARAEWHIWLNRPIPSFPEPLFQNEFRCSAFDMEIIFHSHANKTHFHKKGCAPSLILKVRVLELGSGLSSIPALLNPMINKMADEASAILLLICSHEVWVKVTYDWSTALCLCLCLCRPSFH